MKTQQPKFDKDTVKDYIERNRLRTTDPGDIALGMSIFYRSQANPLDIVLIEATQRELSK